MCCSKNFIKRIVPFFLTFAVGLFIASFFITIAAPKLRFGFRRERMERHLADDRKMELENEQLKAENLLLKIEASDKSFLPDESDSNDLVPAPPATEKKSRK